MIIILNIIMLMSVMIMFINHPLTMGFTLLTQTVMVALLTMTLSYNAWFSYILFLIMVGGMLVLFIYMTSIASNEKFKFSNKIMMMLSLIIGMTMITSIMDKYMVERNIFQFEKINNYNFEITLTKFMNFPYNMIMLMLIIYLFVTLIAVVKISKIKYGPLRQMN